MRVPTAAPVHKVTLHRAETREHILDRARQYVMHARFPVGSGRTFKNDKRLAVFSLISRFLKNLFRAPKMQACLFLLLDNQS